MKQTLYIFKMTFANGEKMHLLRHCKRPKSTKQYKHCMSLLDADIIKRFTYYQL